jgi:antitoxin HicB
MAHDFIYPFVLTPEDSGGFVVTFPDVPEAITQGEDWADALAQATDALDEAIAGRIRRGDDIPQPSPFSSDSPVVLVPALTAAKASLFLALRQARLGKSELASRMGCDENEVRRLLDPRHASRLTRIQQALAVLGKGIAVRMVDEAA